MTLRLFACECERGKTQMKWTMSNSSCHCYRLVSVQKSLGPAPNFTRLSTYIFTPNWSLKIPHQSLVPALSHVSVHLTQFSLHPLDHVVVQPYVPLRKLVSVSLDVVWMGGIVSGGYKAPWEPVKVRTVIEGKRWGGGKKSTKLEKDKKRGK